MKVGKEGVTGEVKATKKIMGKQIGVYAKHNFITKEMNGGVVAGKMRIISNPRAAIHAAKITVLFVKKKKSVNGR